MNAIVTEDNEKTNIRAKLESAIEKAKDACERLERHNTILLPVTRRSVVRLGAAFS